MATGITPQLEKLISRTSDGKVPWKSGSPSMVRWIAQRGNRTFTTTIQVQIQPALSRRNYMFTIQATSPNEVAVQISTATEPEYEDVLMRLFDAAMLASKNSGSQVLDSLLDGLI